jgi:hypothetical protein
MISLEEARATSDLEREKHIDLCLKMSGEATGIPNKFLHLSKKYEDAGFLVRRYNIVFTIRVP